MDIYEQCKADAEKNSSMKVDVLLGNLSKKDADSLRKALLDATIPTRAICRVLEENKIECGMWAVNKWRKANGVVLKSTQLFMENK
jgi:hypothetical protein